MPLRVRSMVGLLPLCAVDDARPGDAGSACPTSPRGCAGSSRNKPRVRRRGRRTRIERDEHASGGCSSIVDPDRLRAHPRARCSTRTSSCRRTACARCRAATATHPFTISLDGVDAHASTTSRPSRRRGLFGGNSNWRGPVWFPVNYLLIEALRVYDRYFGDDFTVEYPTGSGTRADARARSPTSSPRRLIGALPATTPTGAGRCFGGYELFQTDPAWHDLIPFHEYFHGDTGAGLGASHQTGWTGLVADLIIRRRRA